MTLFHTSTSLITAVTDSGLFGSFFFFASEPYQMGSGETLIYKLSIDEDEIIPASQLFYHEDAGKLNELVAELAERIGCDAETAESLIEESANIFDLADDLGIDNEDLGEISWDIQHYSARAARALGFRGVRVTDEQGASYMIDMLGHESELIKVKGSWRDYL